LIRFREYRGKEINSTPPFGDSPWDLAQATRHRPFRTTAAFGEAPFHTDSAGSCTLVRATDDLRASIDPKIRYVELIAKLPPAVKYFFELFCLEITLRKPGRAVRGNPCCGWLPT